MHIILAPRQLPLNMSGHIETPHNEIIIPKPIIVPTAAHIAELDRNGSAFHSLPADYDENESLEEATRRIAVKYAALERNSGLIVAGKLPSLIASGPPGLGKSFTMERALKQSERQRHDGLTPVEDGTHWFDLISGGCTGPGLYHSLWNMRHGGLVLIDDCDGVFGDTETLNLIKISTDSSKERLLSWRKRAGWLDTYEIARTFEFKGHLVFLTNIDFEQEMKKHNKSTEHFKAMIDRARYICLTIRTQRDFMIRIRTVSAGPEGILQKDHGLTVDQSEMLLEYIEQNKMRFYNLSLRLVGQIADSFLTDPEHWRDDIEATKMKTTSE